jgi:hypothetical protein
MDRNRNLLAFYVHIKVKCKQSDFKLFKGNELI